MAHNSMWKVMRASVVVIVALGLVTASRADDVDTNGAAVERGISFTNPGAYGGYPTPDSGYVSDLADLLTLDEEERIEVWLWQVESRTGVEVAVVTIHSISDYPGTANGSIESFAAGLFDAYGIGNLPANKGVLLLVASADRKARIELGAGYGRERDGDARAIMDDKIVPAFKKGDFAGGITGGVRSIMWRFAQCWVGLEWVMYLGGAIAIVLAMSAISMFRKGKRGWGWVCLGLVVVVLLTLLAILRGAVRHLPSSSSDSWGSGGFGGGFGGGFSGGGGATGSW